MRLSIILVHYHTPDLAARSVGALRASLEADGLEGEILLVDNGSTPEDLPGLESLPARRLDPGANLGYAGGVNLGVEHSRGEVLVVQNPDVLMAPGCLPVLLEALGGGAAVVGPQLTLDPAGRMLLPPTERSGAGSEILRQLALRGRPWADWARRRWRRHARRHWEATTPVPSANLSGALLAFPRSTWEAVGPMDDSYPLYFEEVDWLRRVVGRGLEPRFVPSARATHLFNQSGRREPRAARWFEESRRRFQRSHYRALSRFLLRAVEAFPPIPVRSPADPGEDVPELELREAQGSSDPAAPFWAELSASPLGFPASAERLPELPSRWRLPAEAWEALAPGEYVLAVVDSRGTELAAKRVRRPAVAG